MPEELEEIEINAELVEAAEAEEVNLRQLLHQQRHQLQTNHNGTLQPDIPTYPHPQCARSTGGRGPRQNGVTVPLTAHGRTGLSQDSQQIKTNEITTSLTSQVFMTLCTLDLTKKYMKHLV